MRTRVKHQVSLDTVETLATGKNGASWRAYAQRLGYEESYAPTLNQIVRGVPGALTFQAENILRVRLGLAPLRLVEVTTCPDCGLVHTGRCYGKPVVAVVTLGPDEKVTQVGRARTRQRYHRPCLDDAEYAAFLAWRQERRSVSRRED